MRLFRFLILTVLSVVSLPTIAQNALGGHITWTYLGGNQYQIRLTRYIDCFGYGTIPPTEDLFLISTGCPSASIQSFTANFVSETEVSELCPTEIVNSSCAAGLNPGVKRLVYQGTATLDPACTWKVVFNGRVWSYFDNINWSTAPDSYISSEINQTQTSSVTINTTNPVPYECYNGVNSGVIINNLSITVPAGVTATYSAGTPQTTGGSINTSIPTPGYTAMAGLSINPTTGAVTVNTAVLTPGFYTCPITITMTQGATTIGTVTEYMAFVIRDCSITPTVFNPDGVLAVTTAVGQLTNATTVEVCAGDSLAFSISAENSNIIRAITLTETHPAALNGGNPLLIQDPLNINPALGIFSIRTDGSMIGSHQITFNAIDDACLGSAIDDVLNITLIVRPNVNVTPLSALICFGQSQTLTATGGNAYTWTTVSGDATPGFDGNNATQVLESISENTQIEVSVATSAFCDARDTVTVNVALSNVTLVPTAESCLQNDGAIDLSIGFGTGNYSYQWTPTNATSQDINSLDSGNYTVAITDNGLTGCTRTESVTVNTTPVPGGTASITGSATICEGSTTTLQFNLTGNGPWRVNGTGAGVAWPLVINTSPFTLTVTPTATTTYTISSIAYDLFPSCVTNVNIPLTVTVRPLITGTFTSGGPVCSGSPLDLTVNFNTPGSYNVTYIATPADPAGAPNPPGNPWTNGQVLSSFNPTQTTTYTITNVQYTDLPNCPNVQNNPLQVTVNPLPTVTLIGGTSICPGGNTNLTLTATGTAPYTVSGNGGSVTWPITATGNSELINVAPTINTNYCVTGITDANGCASTIAPDCETVNISTSQSPTVTIAITPSANVCAGQSVTLTATPTNAGASPTYQWLRNGSVVAFGATLTFSVALLNNGDNYSCTVTSSETCANPTTATSNTITLSVTANVNPTVNIAASPAGAVCAGTPVTFTATATNGGPTPGFQWLVNGTPQPGETAATFTTSALVNGDQVRCVMSSSLPCVTFTSVNSNIINMTVNPILTPSVSVVASPAGQVCSGTNITFTATPVNGGTTPTYTWRVDGAVVGTNSTTFSSNSLINGSQVTVELASSETCVNSAFATSTPITLDIAPIVTPTITISAAPNTAICAGQSVTFTAVITNGGASPSYAWTVNGTPAGTNSATFTTTTLANNAVVQCTLTSNASCVSSTTAASNSITMTVNPVLTPTVTVAALPTGAICAGTSVTFTATATNGGTSPTFTWTVNGLPQPGTTNTFSSSTLNNGDVVACQLTSSETCVTSATANSTNITMTVNANQVPQVTIAASANPICAGASVTFTATPTNAGATPGYQWRVNGNPVGTNSATYTTSTLTTGSTVECVMTSSAQCNTVPTANSNVITMTVNTNVTPAVTIAASPTGQICAGEALSFTATPVNGGTAPSYTWFVNGIPVVGQTGATLNPTTISDGVPVSVSMNSNETCVTTASAASNVVNMQVAQIPTAILGASAQVCSGNTVTIPITFEGVGPFNYGIYRDGILVQTFTNVAAVGAGYTTGTAGTYTLQDLSDANCTSTATSNSATVTVLPLPTASWNSATASFCAGSSVNIVATVSGASPFSLVINNGSAVPAIGTSYTTSVNTAGTFTINSITDLNGCTATPNSSITVTSIALPVVNAGNDGTICSGGSITLGTPAENGVTYAWSNAALLSPNGATAQPTFTATNATSGDQTYTFTLSASRQQCTVTDNVTVVVHPLPTVSITADDAIICSGASANLTAAGATTYQWTLHPSIASALNAPSILVSPNSASTTYTVTGTDANLCSSQASFTVEMGTPITVSVNASPNQCFGVCDGFIDLTPAGGFPPYTVTWDQAGLNGFSVANLCGGTYTYTISDTQNCTTGIPPLSTTIAELAENTINSVLPIQPVCFGDTNGEISVIEPGASTYSLFSEPSGTLLATGASADFLGLGAGDYSVEVQDVNGCTISSAVITLASVSSEITVDAPSFPTPFCFAETVAFAATGQGGQGTLTFHWNSCEDAVSCQLSTLNPYNLVLTQDTTLYVYASDGNNCRSAIVPVTAILNEPIQLSILNGINSISICQGDCVDLISQTTGGNGNVVVTWVKLPNTPITGTTDCPLFDAQYTATASDGCNPPAVQQLDVTVFETPEVDIFSDTLAGCFPLTVQFSYDTDFSLVDQCIWTFDDGTVYEGCVNVPPHTYSGFGQFSPYITVVTADGCTSSDTLSNPITVYGYPEVNFIYSPEEVNVLETTLQFTNLTEGASQYDWDFGAFGSSQVVNPRITLPQIDNLEAEVCLTATNSDGCSADTCKTIIVESILQVWTPNCFTPDQDKINEVWLPVINGADKRSYHLWIYDRWGNMVFETTDPDKGWNGSVNNGSFYPQNDIFVWRMEVKAVNGKDTEVFEGTITLLR